MERAEIIIGAYMLIGMAGLSGCAFDSPAAPTGTPTQAVKIQCLPIVVYTQADESAFADEVTVLQKAGTSPKVLRFLGDYHAMRDADGACNAGK